LQEYLVINRFPRLLAAGLAAMLVAGSAFAQGRSEEVKPPFPQLSLPDARSSGQRAIDLLGDRLPEVAAWYRKSPDELRALLLNDRMLKVDRRGRLFFEDEFVAPQPATTEPASSTGLLDGTFAPLDQTFGLHSKPGAKRTIYLNFQGATLNNTAWGSGLTALPFDMDSAPYSFSTAELQRIQAIWQRVAEDFAPFDVNVTTQVPSSDLITRSGSADDVFGTTVLITSNVGVYNCSCGGVAYIGVYDDTSDFYKPALVFWNMLGSGEKNVAEAVSHEAGHNMGLNHDGAPGTGYYQGHGSGATGWAPIMGVGYYRDLVQWSKGEYSGANNVQDDYTVMQGNGLPLRADDHGNSVGSATPMGGTSSGGMSSLSATGVIERPTDVDMFSFNAGAGSATVTLSPAARSANLDAMIELRNSAGTVIASANPADALGGSLTVTLPAAGTYYVGVQGVGKGDLATGYSDYGSLGQYALAVSAPTGSGSSPVAMASATPTSGTVPLAVAFSSAGSSDPDGTIASVSWTFGDGASASGATASHTYAVAGTYTATLQVTDNDGLTSARSVTITALPQVTIVTMRVTDIAMSLKVQKNGNARATAVVTVRDSNGNVIPGATVNGSWSGVVSGSASVLSGSTGGASFTSPQTRSAGTFVFTVTSVTLAGYPYDAQLNVETSDSITR
jgi:PKD repeat protein